MSEMRSETDGNYEDFHYFRAAGNKTQEQGTNYHNHPFSPGLYSSLHVPLLFYLKKKKIPPFSPSLPPSIFVWEPLVGELESRAAPKKLTKGNVKSQLI